MYYFRARYYHPGQRRFTQEDPIGYGGGRNLYSYVDGAVLETNDPSGLLKDYEYFGGNPHDWSGSPFRSDGSYNQGGGTLGERRARALIAGAAALYDAFAQRSQITVITVRIGDQVEEILFRGLKVLTTGCGICGQLGSLTLYAGIQVDAFDGVGGTVAAGVFVDRTGAGSFWRIGAGLGMDVSAGIIIGESDSFAGFAGNGQAGYGDFSGSLGSSSGGMAGGGDWSREVGVGIGLPISYNVNVSYTHMTYGIYWR